MALAVTGGQGNVTATITNTDALDNTVKVGELSIVTTPATTNAMFRVSLAITVNITLAAPNIAIALPQSGGPFQTLTTAKVLSINEKGGWDGGIIFFPGTVGDIAFSRSELYVGPSTDIKIPYVLINSSAAQSAFQYNVSYHYAASVIT